MTTRFYTIQLAVTFTGILSKQEAEGLAEGLADHVLDTFNDDDSIQRVSWKVKETYE